MRTDHAEIAQLREDCRRLAEAVRLADQDRQHLLNEIHDGLLQNLTAAAMLLEGAGQRASFAGPDADGNYADGLRLLRESIAEARGLLQGTTIVSLTGDDIVTALERLVVKARHDLRLPVNLVMNCPKPLVSTSTQHLLLRIVQESLVNASKHARATEVEVRLSQCDEGLELVIADNGVGFDPALIAPGHFGVASIRARGEALNAKLVFDTAPNHGTRVVVRFNPIGEREA